MTLLEVMVASALLLTGVIGLAGVFALGIAANKIQGELGTRTVTYAANKIEELLALDFTDTTTDTRVSPATAGGGTGLAAGGSVNPAAPVAGYVDYLDSAGLRAAAPQAAFTRQWEIVDDAGGRLKTIRVIVRSQGAMGLNDRASTTLATMKAER